MRNNHNNSLPFKGRVRVGMGEKIVTAQLPHPHPGLPLEGEGEKRQHLSSYPFANQAHYRPSTVIDAANL
jgi:hypothetical protein